LLAAWVEARLLAAWIEARLLPAWVETGLLPTLVRAHAAVSAIPVVVRTADV
jgi:hypothetical protein